MILLIDNYDSFSYNLMQLVGSIQKERYQAGLISEDKENNYGIKIIRNDEMSVEEIEDIRPEYIILSPGPGRPEYAGICEKLLKKYDRPVRILGVCLGHQAIYEAFGGKITYAKKRMHGKQSEIMLDKFEPIFKDIPKNIKVARYHSLAGSAETLPKCLKVIATAKDGEIMAVKHRERAIYGVQFHPESVLTQHGKQLIENFLN